jgi:hypothetical protein
MTIWFYNYETEINNYFKYFVVVLNHGNRYSDWLRAGRLRDRSSIPGKVKNCLFSTDWAILTQKSIKKELMFRLNDSKITENEGERAFGKQEYRHNLFYNSSRDSVVGIATGYELDDRGVGVRVPVRSRIFSFPSCPDRLWGHSASYTMGNRGTFPEGKVARAWSWPYQLEQRSRKRGSIYPFPHTSLWHSAFFTFLLTWKRV